MPRTLPDVLAILRAYQQELRDMGVAHAAVFGSVARGQAGPSSDVDVLVDLDYDKDLGIFEYARIKLYIDDLHWRAKRCRQSQEAETAPSRQHNSGCSQCLLEVPGRE
jgi:predicted nucleotidyltransferase